MQAPEDLQLATAAFQRKLNEVKKSLGPQEFPWYPYDTFGSTRSLDTLLAPNSVELVKQLAGNLPVLDVGCGDGDLSFFLESLGCQIDAVDYPPTNHNGMRGIRRLKEALGSKIEIHAMDVDGEIRLPRPLYGLTLFLGILYHVKNPFHVLERLAEHSQFCLLSTRIAQTTPRGARMSDEALAYLVGEYELNADESNYWIFSEAGLRRLLERTGWKIHGLVTSGNTANSEPIRLERDERATCLIESLRAPRRDAPKLVAGWHDDEGGWRWTAREFVVEIMQHPLDSGSPAGSESRCKLEFQFSIHPMVAAALGAVTLRARIGSRDLHPQTFEGPGEKVYSTDVPGFTKDANSRIEFVLDQAYRPSSPDTRELGLQVTFETTGPGGRRAFANPIVLIRSLT
jgi:tRNA (mo5U34)-methyltransferase